MKSREKPQYHWGKRKVPTNMRGRGFDLMANQEALETSGIPFLTGIRPRGGLFPLDGKDKIDRPTREEDSGSKKWSMRSATFGLVPDLVYSLPREISLELFRRMCLIHYFEWGLIQASNAGFIHYPLYLSLGQESIHAALSLAIPDYMIFAQHRCHGIYLAFGGDPEKLRDELLGLPSGTSGGRAGSNCIQCHEKNVTMFGHHGFIGENVPLGVGAALGSGRPVLCLFGDGAAEEDYVFAAMGFAVTHRLPVLFVCEDNNLSILTPVEKRRTWSMTKVAKALGMPALDVTDDLWTVLHRVRELKKNLPAFLNCFTCRAHWHVGVGTDGPPEWVRFSLVKEQLTQVGLGKKGSAVETEVHRSMEKLWDISQLPTQSGK